MNLMPQQGMMGEMMPPITPEDIEEAERVAAAPSWEEIQAILHSDQRRNYQVDVETDSTVFEDAEQEKMARIEYLTAMQNLFTNLMPLMERHPQLAGVVKEVAMFANGGFKVGRHLEESLSDAFDELKNMDPQPNPDEQKAKAAMEIKQQEIQADLQKQQAEMGMKQQESQQKLGFESQRFELEKAKLAYELDFKQKELAFKEQELGFRAQEMQMNAANAQFEQGMKRETMETDRQFKSEEMNFKREDAAANRQAQAEDRQFARAEGAQRLDMDREKVAMERQKTNGEMEAKAGEGLRGDVSSQIAALAQQFDQALSTLNESVQAVAERQDETVQAVTAIVSYMTAPKRIKRDPNTKRPIGVEVGTSEARELREMLEGLTAGERALKFDAEGRAEGFA